MKACTESIYGKHIQAFGGGSSGLTQQLLFQAGIKVTCGTTELMEKLMTNLKP
jgi:hypothetical protein